MELYSYQERAIEKMGEWAANTGGVKGGILQLGMGLGKTRTTLTYVKRTFDGTPTLVITTLANLKTWADEIEKWFKGEFPYVLLHGSEVNSIEDVTDEQIQGAYVVLTTYDTAKMFYKKVRNLRCTIGYGRVDPVMRTQEEVKNGKLKVMYATKPATLGCESGCLFFSKKWKNVVLDEAQEIRTLSTIKARAIIGITGDAYFCLSGTPVVNSADDLYSQFLFMGYQAPLKVFERSNTAPHILAVSKEESGVSFTKLNFESVTVELSEAERVVYDRLLHALRASLHHAMMDTGNIMSTDALSFFTWLRAYCACPYTLSTEAKDSAERIEKFMKVLSEEQIDLLNNMDLMIYGSNKLKAIKEVVETIRSRGEKTIIFSGSASALECIRMVLGEERTVLISGDTTKTRKKRDDAIEKFKGDDADVLLMTYQIGSTGLNLTCANNIVLTDPYWNLATEYQAIARAHRIGQEKDVNVYTMIAKNTIETHILRIQKRKQEIIENSHGVATTTHRVQDKKLAREVLEAIMSDTPI